MLNHDLKLNSKIFSPEVSKKSTRQGFGEGLLEAGINKEKIVALCADLATSTKMNLFSDKFPERYVEVGIAEQNLAGVASGMAAMGKIPFISSYAIFNPGRNWEQIRTTICYNNMPVKIIGSHSGLSAGHDGGSHQALEDIALTRVLPNMTVITPCDAIEAKKATITCAKTTEPTYIRVARNETPLITNEETPFEIGRAQIVFVPEIGLARVGIIASGTILYNALVAAQELEKEGIKVKVMNLSTIKPLDKDAIINLAKETRAIITVEEHQTMGGMGSAVAECLVENYPARMELMGIKDDFGQSGTPEELIEHFGLGISHIKEAVKNIIKRTP